MTEWIHNRYAKMLKFQEVFQNVSYKKYYKGVWYRALWKPFPRNDMEEIQGVDLCDPTCTGNGTLAQVNVQLAVIIQIQTLYPTWFSDNYYRAEMIAALANSVTPAVSVNDEVQTLDNLNPDVRLILEEITRFLNMEKLLPSYRHTITVSCLRAIRVLRKNGHVQRDPALFKSYAEYGHFADIRIVALEAVVDYTKVDRSYEELQWLLNMIQTDPVPYVRHKILNMLTKNPPFTKNMESPLRNEALADQLWKLMNSGTCHDWRLRCGAVDLYFTLFGLSRPLCLPLQELGWFLNLKEKKAVLNPTIIPEVITGNQEATSNPTNHPQMGGFQNTFLSSQDEEEMDMDTVHDSQAFISHHLNMLERPSMPGFSELRPAVSWSASLPQHVMGCDGTPSTRAPWSIEHAWRGTGKELSPLEMSLHPAVATPLAMCKIPHDSSQTTQNHIGEVKGCNPVASVLSLVALGQFYKALSPAKYGSTPNPNPLCGPAKLGKDS
ncbi:PREDICTED: transcription initiation factor TFIID subunit 2-like [Elephantulus edwardii]|uniref:transcription initiation factor TFIID subunit 2-like n=1 Tax=Elephantulus edwardii TaxID=28737 RepID=UPI0003F05B19|nr:PREDICTED: transcription initiation factor TFIID subunit 2-like [Elephantulus edwardii]